MNNPESSDPIIDTMKGIPGLKGCRMDFDRFLHCSRVVKESRNVYAIQTREPEGAWHRYSGGFGSFAEAEACLDRYYESGWFPAHMKRMPTRAITHSEACASVG